MAIRELVPKQPMKTMATTDLDTIRDLVQTDGYRSAGKTGEKMPPAVGGWNRKVELRDGKGTMKEMYVDADTWDELCDADWFRYGR